MTTDATESGPKPKVGKGQPAHWCGKKGRSGRTKGVPQKNAISINPRLPLGEYPLKLRRLTREARKYKRHLERLAPLAKVDVSDPLIQDELAHEADLAASAEGARSLAMWLLRDRFKEMTVSDILKCNEVILKCKTLRNAAAARYRGRLGINVPPPSPWLTIEAKSDDHSEGEDAA